jgi:DNA-binding transcriptional LysR family regulator
MDLVVVESFRWVAQFKSIKRAAERMHVARTAMSARILGLERDLGVQLLDRSQRRLRLTLAGARFVT